MLATVMGHLRLACLALLALLAIGLAPADAQTDEVDIEVFYRELEPYGRWTEHARYGEVWIPDVEQGWRPYTRGQWVNTDEHGWYWESEEPFGWAVYHYGRWHLDDRDGWVWVPGTEWGPAWVAWRHSEDDVGWAPLPPEAEWRDGEIVHAASFYDSPRFSPAWCFVPVALLTAPRLYSHVVSSRRNSYYLGRTRFVPWQRNATPHFYNGGFDRRRWESLTGRRIEVRRVVAVDRPFRDVPRGRVGEVRVYRPRVVGLPRDDGRPGFRPPERRFEPPGRPDPRRSDPRWPDSRWRDGRQPDVPRVERDRRPSYDPPVGRREPPERRTTERPPEQRRDIPQRSEPFQGRREQPGDRRPEQPRGADGRPPEVRRDIPQRSEPFQGRREQPGDRRPEQPRGADGRPPELRRDIPQRSEPFQGRREQPGDRRPEQPRGGDGRPPEERRGSPSLRSGGGGGGGQPASSN